MMIIMITTIMTIMEKFRDVTLTTPKVIGLHTLNFKPNFTCSPLNFWGDPRPP